MLEIALGFLLLIVMLIIGVPVMYCFGAALIFCSLTLGYEPTMIFPTMYGKLSSVVLLSIPLFILAGKIMEHGKIGDALINFIEMFVGKIKGSLAIMTATEAAAVSALYAFPVAVFIYKGTSLRGMKEVLLDSARSTGVVMVMCVMTMALGQILTMENLPTEILGLLTAVSENKYVILLMINLFLVFIGMIMDDTCATMLCAPLLIPLGQQLGVDPYHMCAILVTNIGMGNVTPPTAPFLYMASSLADVSAAKVIKPVLLIILFAYVPTLILTTYIPQIATFLPNLITG